MNQQLLKNIPYIYLVFCLLLSPQSVATSVAQVYKQVSDSVVVIKTAEKNISSQQSGTSNRAQPTGIGTGFIISKTGEILTASHVVQTADEMTVELKDGRIYAAQVTSSVDYADLALIKLLSPPADLKPVKLGESSKATLGEKLIVIGTPFGIEQTLTVGYLSAKRTNDSPFSEAKIEVLQSDAAINQGNSGGPVFNLKGEAIGIVSSILSTSGGNQGIGFAISIDTAKELLLNRPAFWTGLSYVPLRGELARALGSPSGFGLLVQKVARSSLGEKLGLQHSTVPIIYEDFPFFIGGDIIVKFNGVDIEPTLYSSKRFFEELSSIKEGDDIRVTVSRHGKFVELATKL